MHPIINKFLHRIIYSRLHFDKVISDELFLKICFQHTMEVPLNLKNPKTFSEKLQWLKLYDRKPIYTTMVDKYAVKKYVADRIGREYIIPTLGVWDKFEDIDFDKLPDQFVLKCTHDSGGLVICRDKSCLDLELTREKISNSLKRDFYLCGREWPYKDVPRRIVAEKYMEDSSSDELKDYKFYCFNGRPMYCQVIADRSTKETIDFFDMEWNHQEFYGLNPKCGPAAKPAAKPAALECMINIARKLSNGIPFLRVDLYYINNRVYFGELTFYPASGFGLFTPMEWNEKLGACIKIPI